MKIGTENCRSAARHFVRWAIFIGLVLACPRYGKAQHLPSLAGVDVSGSYSYLYANSSDTNKSFPTNGGGIAITYNLRRSLAAVADVGVYRFGGLGLSSTMHTYLFGPRFSVLHRRRYTPFAQVLLGAGRLNAQAGSIQAGENSFAMAIGGGVDAPLGRHFSVRVLQLDYLLTHFTHENGASASQNNMRVSTGITFHLGSIRPN